MVSKALVVGEYQRKLEAMAAYDDVKLVCVVPHSWKTEGGELKLEASHTRGYRLAVQPIRFNGNFHLFHFPTLGRLFRALKPDLVHVDEEFHRIVAEATGNSVLVALMDNLSSRTLRARLWRGVMERGALDRTKQWHRAILEGLEARDPEVATAADLMHLAEGEAWLRRALGLSTNRNAEDGA